MNTLRLPAAGMASGTIGTGGAFKSLVSLDVQ